MSETNTNSASKSGGMKLTLHQRNFFATDAARRAKTDLKLMMVRPEFNTRVSFGTETESLLTFVDKHMLYLSKHPKVNPQQYISTLKLMTRINR